MSVPCPTAKRAGSHLCGRGVISPLPGIIGSAQATEALKLIIGGGESLRGRMLVVDT